MKIDIDTIKRTNGVGKKTLDRIIEQHKLDSANKEYYNSTLKLNTVDDFQIELNNIYHSEAVEFMRKNIPSKSIDMILTSPPYDTLREYDGYIFDHEPMLNEIYRVLKDGGVCVWIVGDETINGSETGTSFKQALYAMSIGFNLNDTMIYEKNTSSFPASSKSLRYTQIFEYMFIFSKGKPKTVNLIKDKRNKYAGQTNWGTNTARSRDGELVDIGDIKSVPLYSPRNNIWKYIVGGGFASKDKLAYEHPAIFPEELAKDHILSWSNEDDIILDPMCGSGTTCMMANKLNRRYIGIDISEKYVNLSKARIEYRRND